MTQLSLKSALPLSGAMLARLLREASPTGNVTGTTPTGYATATRATVVAGALNTVFSSFCPIGFVWLVQEVHMASDRQAVLFAQVQTSSKPNAYSSAQTFLAQTGWGGGAGVFSIVGTNGGSKTWQFNGQLLVQEAGLISGGYASPDTVGAFAVGSAVVVQLTNDLNWDAKYTMCVAGDSITCSIPSTSAAVGANMYPFIVTESLRNLGVDVRQINKGVPGTTSWDAARWLDEGRYDVPYDLLLVGYGMNDASTAIATSQANFQANLNKFIAHRNRHRPAADILFLGPSYTDAGDRPNIANYRTWVQGIVTAAQTGQPAHVTGGVYYLDLNAGVPGIAAAPATNMVEAAGSRVHPNIAGHALIAPAVLTAVQATTWYLRVHG